MFGILFAKTFFLVGMMLVITTITTRINKAYETTAEMVLTILGTFGFLFAITFFSHIFPLNLLLVACFAGVVGWSMGPTITLVGRRFKLKRFLKARNIKTKKDSEKENVVIYYKESAGGDIEVVSEKELDTLLKDFEVEIEKGGDPYDKKWQDIVFQAMLGTALAVFASAANFYIAKYIDKEVDYDIFGL